MLAVTSHYFEFATDGGRLLKVEQLREGDEVSVVVTTGGGLVRYKLGDRVVVSGFCERTPCIEFIGRENTVSDLCGEKLTDAFVRKAISETGINGFSLLVPGQSGYTLYTSEEVSPALVDEKLSANFQYAWALRVGQLKPVKVVRVHQDAGEVYLEVCQSRGQLRGDIKPRALDSWDGWHDVLSRKVDK